MHHSVAAMPLIAMAIQAGNSAELFTMAFPIFGRASNAIAAVNASIATLVKIPNGESKVSRKSEELKVKKPIRN